MRADIILHAHRKLRRLDRFKPFGLSLVTSAELPCSLSVVPLLPNENVLGVYENVYDSLANAIVFTDIRFHLSDDDGWQFCNYADISSVAYAKFTPERIDTLVVVALADGSSLRFNVAGFNEHEYGARTFDSYQIGSFLECAENCKSVS